MKTENSVELIGYLGNDPICKTAVNGSSMARIRLATDRFRRDRGGTVHRKTTWHDILAWDTVAEQVPNNFIKGSHVLIKGEIRHRTYNDNTGHKRYITEVHAHKIMNLDR